MFLRAYSRFAAMDGRGIVRFTIDAQSSTGFNQEANVGRPPLSPDAIEYTPASRSGEAMSQQRLQDWLDGIEWPYAPPPQDDAPGP